MPALDVPLDGNANGHSEQFKHSCIVQPEHCGFHCNKSNVTALGEGTRDCHCLNKLSEALRRYFNRAKEACTQILKNLGSVQKLLVILICSCDLCQATSHNLRFNQGMSHLVSTMSVCTRARAVLSKLTFTIFEDPLTPSRPERPLVSVNYPQYLQLPAHQVSAPIWSSRRQQAGRQGRGKCWIPVGR